MGKMRQKEPNMLVGQVNPIDFHVITRINSSHKLVQLKIFYDSMKVRLKPKRYIFLLSSQSIWLYLHPELFSKLYVWKHTSHCTQASSVVNICIWHCILVRKYTITVIKMMEFSAYWASSLMPWFRNMHLVKSRLMGLPCIDWFKYVLKCFPEAQLNRWNTCWNKKTGNQKAVKDG